MQSPLTHRLLYTFLLKCPLFKLVVSVDSSLNHVHPLLDIRVAGLCLLFKHGNSNEFLDLLEPVLGERLVLTQVDGLVLVRVEKPPPVPVLLQHRAVVVLIMGVVQVRLLVQQHSELHKYSLLTHQIKHRIHEPVDEQALGDEIPIQPYALLRRCLWGQPTLLLREVNDPIHLGEVKSSMSERRLLTNLVYS